MSAIPAAQACPHHGSDCPLLLTEAERAEHERTTEARRAAARERLAPRVAELLPLFGQQLDQQRQRLRAVPDDQP
jgi:hypothetical protein